VAEIQPLPAIRASEPSTTEDTGEHGVSLNRLCVAFLLYRLTIYLFRAGSRHDTIVAMKKLMLSDYQALAEFRYQIRRFLHFSEQAIKQAGLERGQYQLMLAIKGMPAGVRPRIRELANRMQVRHHSAVELINRLESRGWVHRERAQDDRREVLLALTPRGEQILAELALHHRDELRTAGPTLVTALRRVMREEGASERKRAAALPKKHLTISA
jgi:DNA-binding MarR family transcriptional regulator